MGKGHWGDEELDRLLDRERSVAAFLNGLWFTEVSGRREATLVLNEFQKVLGTPVLLTELRDEQESLVRVVEVHRRIDNVAMDKARKEQERRREQLEKAAEKRLEIIVLVLTVISTMLALLALVSDPNLGLFAVGFILTGIVALIGGIRVKRLLRGDCEGQERQPCRFVTRRHHRETNDRPVPWHVNSGPGERFGTVVGREGVKQRLPDPPRSVGFVPVIVGGTVERHQRQCRSLKSRPWCEWEVIFRYLRIEFTPWPIRPATVPLRARFLPSQVSIDSVMRMARSSMSARLRTCATD